MEVIIADMLDTWQSMSDWVKVVAIVTPFAFALLWRGQSLAQARALAIIEHERRDRLVRELNAPHLRSLVGDPARSDVERLLWLDGERAEAQRAIGGPASPPP